MKFQTNNLTLNGVKFAVLLRLPDKQELIVM